MAKATEDVLAKLKTRFLPRGLVAGVEQAERARRDAVKGLYMATRRGPLLTRH